MTIHDRQGPIETVGDHTGLFEIIGNRSGLLGTFLDHLGPLVIVRDR